MTLSRPPEELGQALGFLLGLYFGDEGLEAAAVLDVVVEHVVLVGLAVGVWKTTAICGSMEMPAS